MKIEQALLNRLAALIGPSGVTTSAEARLAYECDAYTVHRGQADVILLPERHEQIVPIVRELARARIPIVPRGSGTSLAGGAFAARGGALISLAKMRRILELNAEDRYAAVEPGVINDQLSQAAAPFGLHYAPDPSSQSACTIGGNVANNAGGPHTLKHGVTSNHVLGLEMVLADGEAVTFGGPFEDAPGLDLRGFLTGSEGTMGVISKVWVRLSPAPEAWKTLLAVFPTFESSMRAVSTIIGAGIIPAALELMDRLIIAAVEDAFHVGLPRDAGAVLLIELDGRPEALERQADRVADLARQNGASEVRVSRSEEERAALWKGRKKAGAAIGLLSPSYCTQDVVIPRSRLAEMAVAVETLAAKHNVRIANLLHAGDGNLHPLVLFDERNLKEVEGMIAASREIVELTIELGGSISGEHGIGIEKVGFLERQFGPEDIDMMRMIKRLFDPAGLLNPGKVLPDPDAAPVVPKRQAAP